MSKIANNMDITNKKVCFFGDYAQEYPRELNIKNALSKKGVEVLECNCAIKHSKQGRGNILFYLPKAYYRLLRQFFALETDFDYFLIPQNNRLIVPLAFLLSRIKRKRVIIDAFDLAYETAIIRGKSCLEAIIRHLIERLALRLSDHVLALTQAFKSQYVHMHNLNPSKISVLPPGANENKFKYIGHSPSQDNGFRVLYWGNFLRHHGVDAILEAAALLRDHKDIRFVFVGKGLEADRMQQFAAENLLAQVEFLGFVPDQELLEQIRDSHVCLGVFSKNIKAQCSITNKVSEALAMGKAVITNESPATLHHFNNRQDIYLVPPEDPQALAEAILALQADQQLRKYLERNARRCFEKQFSEVALGARLFSLLHDL
jgi:glycosyltransferase involved in cell wall biosynthesis